MVIKLLVLLALLLSPIAFGSNASGGVGGELEEWTGHIVTVADKTYYVIPSSLVARKVVSVHLACQTSGTVTVDMKIGGTNITTCNGISVTSTPGTTTCSTGATSSLAAAGVLTLVTRSNSSCLDLSFDVKTVRQ